MNETLFFQVEMEEKPHNDACPNETRAQYHKFLAKALFNTGKEITEGISVTYVSLQNCPS